MFVSWKHARVPPDPDDHVLEAGVAVVQFNGAGVCVQNREEVGARQEQNRRRRAILRGVRSEPLGGTVASLGAVPGSSGLVVDVVRLGDGAAHALITPVELLTTKITAHVAGG